MITQRWILAKFRCSQQNYFFVVINIYMPTNPKEKSECWRSLKSIKDFHFIEDCILVGDFNVVRNNMEKRGGFFGRDPFREKLEGILEK